MRPMDKIIDYITNHSDCYIIACPPDIFYEAFGQKILLQMVFDNNFVGKQKWALLSKVLITKTKF